MPIYLAEEISGNLKPTLLLEERGLKMRSVSVSRLDPQAFPYMLQPVYRTYVNSISAFLAATISKKRIPITALPQKISVGVNYQFPLPLPNTVVSFGKPLSSEEEQAIQALGAIVIPVKKDSESNRYRFPEGVLNSDGLKALLAHPKKVDHYTVTAYGQANLASVLAYLRVKGIFSAFIKTQFYPAFRTSEEADKALSAHEDIFSRKGKRPSTQVIPSQKKARTEAGGDDGSSMHVDEEEVEEDYETASGYSAVGEDISRASPPSINTRGWGRSQDAPQTYGLVFPYFDGLLDDDTNYVSRVINEFFLLSLGTTTRECSLEANAIKGGLGQFASSSLGRIMTHIATGVKLAIQGQAQLYLSLTEDGRYSGFSLHGAGFTVNIQGRLYDVQNESDMIHDLTRIDEHTRALAEVLKIAASVIGKRTVGVPKKKLKVAEVTSARDLHQYLSQLSFSEEQTSDILAEGSKMSFPERPWRMSIDNVITVISHLCDGTSVPIDAPMYLGGGNLLTTNNVVRNMSVFGELGFSFRTPNGTRFRLPNSRSEDTLYKETKDPKGKVKRPWRTFVIQKKALETCASDWLAFLADRTMEVREQRSSAFKSEVFGGEQGRRLWMHLIDVVPKLEQGPALSVEEVDLEGEREDSRRELDFSDFI